MKQCKRTGCTLKSRVWGLCTQHYSQERYRKWIQNPDRPQCEITDCEGLQALTSRYCGKHAQRVVKYGDPYIVHRKANFGRLDPETAPTLYPTLYDIVWAAGYYEGEGNCNADNWGSLTTSVSQKDKEKLYWLRERFGGTVLKRSRAQPYEISGWSISGARARGFLQTIYGLLSSRRQEQIRKAMRIGEFREAD